MHPLTQFLDRPASRAVVLFLIGMLAFLSLEAGRDLLNRLIRNGGRPSAAVEDGRDLLFQVDLGPVIIAATLYNEGKKAAVYRHSPYMGIHDSDWVTVAESTPNVGSGTGYPYSPAYLLPFTWLVQALEYYDLVYLMAVSNTVIALFLVVCLAVRMADDWLLQLAIVCTFSLAHAVEVPVLLGQNFLLNLLFTAGFVLFYLEGRRALALGCFGLASLVKPWGPVLVLLPLLKRDYRMVSTLLLSLVALFGAQYFWEPELARGYVEQTQRNGEVSILGHNNVSLAAALQRLFLAARGSTWQSWETWVHAGRAPTAVTLVCCGLALGVLFIGWIARSDATKAQSVLVAIFLLANVYWNFYGLMLVPLVLATLLAMKPATATELSTARSYATSGGYVLAVILASIYRPPLLGDPSVDEILRSLGFLLVAALLAAGAFPRARIEALLMTLCVLVTYNVRQKHLYKLIDYVMAETFSDRAMSTASAMVTLIPSVLFLTCFAAQCRRERVLGAHWRHRLAPFQRSDSQTERESSGNQ